MSESTSPPPSFDIELGDRLDGAHPARRIRRDFHGVLVVFLDLPDGLAQAAMQVRVVSEVLAHRVADALELALDDALLRFAARREQHFAVALREPRLRMRQRVRGDSQAVRYRATGGANRLVGGTTREVHDRDQQDYPDDGREGPARV